MAKGFSGIDLKPLASSVLDIAVGAGHSIMDVYRQSDFEVQVKRDSSPLTQADLVADQFIFDGLSKLLSSVPVWSEERLKPAQSGERSSFWLVDPLDGTKEFLKRNGEFTVNIALIVEKEPVLGVIHAPASGESFVGLAGFGAFDVSDSGAFDQPVQCMAPSVPDAPLRVVGSRSNQVYEQNEWLEALGAPYVLQGVGSSIKFCRIAQGKAHVYVRHGPTSQWDTAAGQAILEAAGGTVLDSRGNRLLYGLDRNVINDSFIAAGPVAKALRL